MLYIILLAITCLYFPQTYAANAAGYNPSSDNVSQESLAHFRKSEPSRIFHPESSQKTKRHVKQHDSAKSFITTHDEDQPIHQVISQSNTSDMVYLSTDNSTPIQHIQSDVSSTPSSKYQKSDHSMVALAPKSGKLQRTQHVKSIPHNPSPTEMQEFPKHIVSHTNPTPTMPLTSPVAPTPYGTDTSTPSRLSSTPKEPVNFQKLCEDIAAKDPLFEHWARLQVISHNKNPLRVDDVYETMFNLYEIYSFSDYIKDIDMLYNETLQDLNAMILTLNQPITYRRISTRDAIDTRKALIDLEQSDLNEEDQISFLLSVLEALAKKYPVAKIIYSAQMNGISKPTLESLINGILACQDEDDIILTIRYLLTDLQNNRNAFIASHATFKQSLPVYFSSITKQSKNSAPKKTARSSAKRIPLANISEQERFERIQQRAKQQDLVLNLSL